jgi:hypothetical protein
MLQLAPKIKHDATMTPIKARKEIKTIASSTYSEKNKAKQDWYREIYNNGKKREETRNKWRTLERVSDKREE